MFLFNIFGSSELGKFSSNISSFFSVLLFFFYQLAVSVRNNVSSYLKLYKKFLTTKVDTEVFHLS